jgi:predicted nucleic acid-binding protein
MSKSPDCVVDASVGIKLFIDEALSDAAHALFGRLADDAQVHFFVPDLFYIECTNILWKYHLRYGLSADDANAAVAHLEQLRLQSVPTAHLMMDALAIAVEHAITAYDAAYVALAQRLAVPLVTADQALVRKLAETRFAVQWLGG